MRTSRCGLPLMLSLLFSASALAEVSVQGTRVIYPAAQPEVSVALKNEGARASLLQAWVADGDIDQKPEASQAPFILDKPLFRLDAGQSHALRIRSLPTRAPKDDREHLYWLNVVDVPPREAAAAENTVQLAIRFRMKLLYRPDGVGVPVDPAAKVMFRQETNALMLRNDSPHYFNVAEMTLVSATGERALGSFYLEPGQTRTVDYPEGFAGPLTAVRYSWVDDDGILHPESPSIPSL